ncbi:tRNA-uridine aminocarboxypropyltransferase 2 [Pyrgilauda ruficollis]|uniref:tRNA-uridine aminocarboxypropyltransferase 2 n=1 Tax=Pyrgilauda ruficollis TaxID=221976 RepID=UPI001B85DB7D|nr:tRNA-uridine aminocarboxypropyltransferase 2 [Pyrgilauda ruficollis]
MQECSKKDPLHGKAERSSAAVISLQLMVKTTVRQAVHLQPMEICGGAELNLQLLENPTPEQVDAQRRPWSCGKHGWSGLLAGFVELQGKESAWGQLLGEVFVEVYALGRAIEHAPRAHVEGASAALQEVRAAIQRDTDSSLVVRNLRKFSTFEAQFPRLNKPRYHCQPAYWPARERLCSSSGQQDSLLPFSRPQKVCLCPFLPVHPLKVSTCLYIIQHPAEESRVLRTVPLLAACLPPDKCKILVGRRFNEDRYPELASVCRNPNTLILYPGAEATNLEEVVVSSSPSVMIIIDGTWSQAKDIFYKNSLFRLPKQVQLKPSISSQYVIRTQPTNTCLSTLECAAVALSIMEKNKSIQETILHPLQALCSFQLQHGAQIHHSKEHLLKNGLYDKPMPKNKRKLRRMELLLNNVKI